MRSSTAAIGSSPSRASRTSGSTARFRPCSVSARASRASSRGSARGFRGFGRSGDRGPEDRVREVGQSDLPLDAGRHVPYGRLRGVQLFLPEQHGIAGSDCVRVVEVLRRSASDEIDVRPEARGPEGRQDLDRLLLDPFPDRHDVRVERPRWLGYLLASAAMTSRSSPRAKPVCAMRSPPNTSARLYAPPPPTCFSAPRFGESISKTTPV